MIHPAAIENREIMLMLHIVTGLAGVFALYWYRAGKSDGYKIGYGLGFAEGTTASEATAKVEG